MLQNSKLGHAVDQSRPLVTVDGLTLTIGPSGPKVVDSVSFCVAPGEVVGIVGESGSGKTMAAKAIMRLQPQAICYAGGTILFDGRDMNAMPVKELRALRGANIGMVFQEPMTSLNPSITVGRQMEEGLQLHRKLDARERRDLIVGMLRRVGMPDPASAWSAYPHQFSGGMRQRIMLASVMLLKPRLLIADEPTTALDAVVQREVLQLMVEMAQAEGTAILLISHDLAMVAHYTDRVIVMEKGRVVEEGSTHSLLSAPSHPYTRKLLAAMPRRLVARERPAAEPVISVSDLVVDYPGKRTLFGRSVAKRAIHRADLTIHAGEIVALVGGSGSGKTTLGRVIAGLVKPSQGQVRFRGEPIAKGSAGYARYRHDCQMVFQDPYSSLDPRMKVGQIVGEALRLVEMPDGEQRHQRIIDALDEVGLDARFAGRFPHELSGGQRQRVAIARAMIRRPAFVIGDEPVSALDMTVRAQILDLLTDLQKKYGFACLFISHDLAAVEQIADRVIVMEKGRIVEEGTRDQIFDTPSHDYTRKLLCAIPALETTVDNGIQIKWRLEEPVSTDL